MFLWVTRNSRNCGNYLTTAGQCGGVRLEDRNAVKVSLDAAGKALELVSWQALMIGYAPHARYLLWG